MSYATMVVFGDQAVASQRVEFRNAWGGAARIWQTLQRHIGWEGAGWVTRDDLRPLWNLVEHRGIPACDRVALAVTFDRIYVPRALVPKVAAYLREFARNNPTDTVDHVSAFADAMESSDGSAIGFHHTSVGDDVWVDWDYDADECRQVPYTEGTSIADVLPDLLTPDSAVPRADPSTEANDG